MKKLINKWFTFVELMVVIVILGVLGAIWFVSFSSYLSSTRDANRISQLEVLYKGLTLYSVADDLPMPDNKIDIILNSNFIAYQWNIWSQVIEEISYTSKAIDPYSKDYFSYYMTRNKKFAQLLTVLENDNWDYYTGYFGQTFANEEENKIYVKWNKLGIIVNSNNEPLEKIDEIKTIWSFNLTSIYGKIYKSYLTNDEYVKGDATSLFKLEKVASVWWKWCKITKNNFACIKKVAIQSCLQILKNWNSIWDWVYHVIINEFGDMWNLYCDMTTDWWGWTMVANAQGETQDIYWYNEISKWIPSNSENCNLDNECLSVSWEQMINWDSMMVYTRWFKVKGDNCNDRYLTIKDYTKLEPLWMTSTTNWFNINNWAHWTCDTLSEVSAWKSVSNRTIDPAKNWLIWMGVNFNWNDKEWERAILFYGPTFIPQGLWTYRNWTTRKIDNQYWLDTYAQKELWDGASTAKQIWFIR